MPDRVFKIHIYLKNSLLHWYISYIKCLKPYLYVYFRSQIYPNPFYHGSPPTLIKIKSSQRRNNRRLVPYRAPFSPIVAVVAANKLYWFGPHTSARIAHTSHRTRLRVGQTTRLGRLCDTACVALAVFDTSV
jgi:hypothetical protein